MPRFVVVGAGGVGGWLLSGLAHFCEYRAPGSVLMVIDGDSFEEKNLERQDFQGFGNKALERVEELQPRFPNTVMLGVAGWVVSNDQETSGTIDDGDGESGVVKIRVADLLEDGDVVYAVVDNMSARRIIFDQARQLDNIDVISAGNDDDLFASAYIYRRRDGQDITDHPIVMHTEEYLHPADRNPGEMSCSERATLEGGHQLLVANVLASTLALTMTHRFVFGDEDPCCAAEMYVDLNLVSAYAEDRTADPQSIQIASSLINSSLTNVAKV